MLIYLKYNKTVFHSNLLNCDVGIINKLKDERKDQEQVIALLRKMIGDEEKIDKYLKK